MNYSEVLPPIPPKRVVLIAALSLVALTFATYGASLQNGFAILDDGLLIYENNAVREISPATLKAVFTHYDPELYIPLTFVSYQLEYQIGGYHPFIYHFTNLLLHTLNVLLVLCIVFLLCPVASRTYAGLLAGLCAALFAIHPLHVETVAWAAARKDVLSAFFFLLSLFEYLRYGTFQKRPAYYGSLVAFFLGLLAKVTILPLPFVLLLCDWWQGRKWTKDLVFEKVPYFALSFLFGWIALGGKQGIITSLTFLQKFLLACKSIVLSLQHILFPVHLSVFYPQLTEISLMRPEFLFAIALVALLLGIAWYGWKRKRSLTFGILFFLLTLAPTFLTPSKGGENVYITSDRYAYLPSIGILLLVASALVWCFKRQRAGVWALLCALGVLLATLTLHQSLLWGDSVGLFTQATSLSPEFYLGHINLGVSERLQRKLTQATEEFKRAIALRPLANTYGALAQVYAEQGRIPEAIEEFQKGLAIDPMEYELHHGLGQIFALQGQSDQALAEYEKTLQLMPPAGNAYLELARRAVARRDIVLERIGILYGERGEHEHAIEYYRQAIEENPFFADAHYNLAVGLGNAKKEDEAIAEYEEAVRLDGVHIKARVNLALLLAKRGERLRAVSLLQEVLSIDPTNAMAKSALEQLGQRKR